MTTFSWVNQKCHVVVNCMLRQQGDNTLIIHKSCHAIVKQDDSHYTIKLAPVLFENMTVTSMDITKCSYCVPSFSNKKMTCQERWDDSHFLIYHPCRHLLFHKIIVVPYVDTNAKVTDFLPFCAIGISMCQKMLSQNLTPSLCTTSYVHKLQRWQPLSPIFHYQN